MRDAFGREIDYLRISITDRCNFRCRYCMPPEGIHLIPHGEILSYEEFLRIIAILGQHGISKLRLTGGEPLVRKGITDFIRGIKALGTIKDLAMTTNGSLLEDMAQELKTAGLDRINISLDTLNPDRFSQLTGLGEVQAVLRGIVSALQAGLAPVKLNVVLTEMLTQADLAYFLEQVFNYDIAVRFIEYMPVGRCGIQPGYGVAAIKSMLNQAGCGVLEPVPGVRGNGPAKYYRLPGTKGVFGFITPMSEHYCHACNRIRLTADGKIKPCLLSNQEIDIKAALRSGKSDQEIYQRFIQALQEKPLRHRLEGEGTDLTRGMSQVGG